MNVKLLYIKLNNANKEKWFQGLNRRWKVETRRRVTRCRWRESYVCIANKAVRGYTLTVTYSTGRKVLRASIPLMSLTRHMRYLWKKKPLDISLSLIPSGVHLQLQNLLVLDIFMYNGNVLQKLIPMFKKLTQNSEENFRYLDVQY